MDEVVDHLRDDDVGHVTQQFVGSLAKDWTVDQMRHYLMNDVAEERLVPAVCNTLTSGWEPPSVTRRMAFGWRNLTELRKVWKARAKTLTELVLNNAARAATVIGQTYLPGYPVLGKRDRCHIPVDIVVIYNMRPSYVLDSPRDQFYGNIYDPSFARYVTLQGGSRRAGTLFYTLPLVLSFYEKLNKEKAPVVKAAILQATSLSPDIVNFLVDYYYIPATVDDVMPRFPGL